MNCEKCQELLSELLDGALPGGERAQLNAHLDGCGDCAAAREELTAIVSVARDASAVLAAPPNEAALWLRIRNTVEAEADASVASAARAAAAVSPARESFWARLTGRQLVLSLPQVASAAALVAVAVSLVTAFGMRSVLTGSEPQPQPQAFRQAARRPMQQNPDVMMIDYLKQRVDERKVRWNPRMRAAYEQNMSVIDATVNEMLQELDRTPYDTITNETLNSAMRDKVELLKEFSEL